MAGSHPRRVSGVCCSRRRLDPRLSQQIGAVEEYRRFLVGDDDLLREQLRLALRILALLVVLVGSLPLVFHLAPGRLSELEVGSVKAFRLTRRAADKWESARFSSLLLAQAFSRFDGESRNAPPPQTHNRGSIRKKSFKKVVLHNRSEYSHLI